MPRKKRSVPRKNKGAPLKNKKKSSIPQKILKIALWKWVITSIPLVVSVVWAVSIIFTYNEIQVVYEQASPGGINTLLSLIFLFILCYGSFVVIEFRKRYGAKK
ncbi:hypothetical protein KY366_04560 [Candidatus Woesearchaeota archaeon]|nr:hypothetical protein [Candidatus Woesearchaeota archaeon]